MFVGSSVAMSNAGWFVFGVALFVVLHAGSLCSVFFRAGACSAQRATVAPPGAARNANDKAPGQS